MDPLRKLILITLGKEDCFAHNLTQEDWERLFKRACEQRIAAVLLPGIERLPEDQKPPTKVLADFEKARQIHEIMNESSRERCVHVSKLLEEAGLECCILKGEAYARYYPYPLLRHCGDIDCWINGETKRTIRILKEKGFKTSDFLYQECKLHLFEEEPVDIHFHPQKMFNPFFNKRLQRFFDDNFDKRKERNGFWVPSHTVEMVHCVVHLYRHMLGGYMTYHQLMDLYYILKRTSLHERTNCLKVLESIGLAGFCSKLMYALVKLFGMDVRFTICDQCSSKKGRYFMMLVKGKKEDWKRKRFEYIKYTFEYPRDILWAPAAKVCQLIWRIGK